MIFEQTDEIQYFSPGAKQTYPFSQGSVLQAIRGRVANVMFKIRKSWESSPELGCGSARVEASTARSRTAMGGERSRGWI